jgi:hypothetical protein
VTHSDALAAEERLTGGIDDLSTVDLTDLSISPTGSHHLFEIHRRGRPGLVGDNVLVWDGSANRDERRFPDPMSLRVTRDPNPHLAFGHGAHICLGAHLARMEIRVALSETLKAFSHFSLSGEPEWTRSNRHTGLRHLPLRMTPSR